MFPITDRQVRYVFAAAGKRGIGRPVHPHELRHLYVKTLIDGGVPVLAASKMVGHSDTKTTERWYYDLTAEQRRAKSDTGKDTILKVVAIILIAIDAHKQTG